MKITKSELQQIIKEETDAVLSEGHLGDLKWRDNPANPEYGKTGVEDPDSDKDDAQELAAGLALTGFDLTKDRGYYFIEDKETEKQAAKRAMRSDTRSEFEAAQDVLSKLGR